jgi:hypothetical protein
MRGPVGIRKLFNFARVYLLNAFTRRLSRETFRAAVLACTIPFCAARMSNGWAARRAAAAAPGSPAAIASSTLRTCVRIWLRRDRLTPARRSILRTAFLADFVFATKNILDTGQRESGLPRWKAGQAWPLEHDFELHDHAKSKGLGDPEHRANNHEPFRPSTRNIGAGGRG